MGFHVVLANMRRAAAVITACVSSNLRHPGARPDPEQIGCSAYVHATRAARARRFPSSISGPTTAGSARSRCMVEAPGTEHRANATASREPSTVPPSPFALRACYAFERVAVLARVSACSGCAARSFARTCAVRSQTWMRPRCSACDASSSRARPRSSPRPSMARTFPATRLRAASAHRRYPALLESGGTAAPGRARGRAPG